MKPLPQKTRRPRDLPLRSFLILSAIGLVVASGHRAAAGDAAPPGNPPSLSASAGVDLAKVPAGTVIDASNLAKYGDAGGPSIRWLVEHGVKLKVGAYRKVTGPRPFLEATAKYSARVQLSADGMDLVDHVAGLPFPNIDPADPRVAIKLMFDVESAVARDDLDVRNFECRSGTPGSGGSPFHVERTFIVDHFRRLYFRERTTVEPIPELPVNRDAVRYKEALFPLIEPFDLKGTGMTMNRYLDHSRDDDTWLYLPQIRRVRRLAASQRADPLFKQDIDLDSFGGFAGKISGYDWKYLGEKTILATFHDATIPVEWGAAPGDYVHAGSWEPRRVWVVEGVPKTQGGVYSTTYRYAQSRRILYIDQDTFRIPYSDIYDLSAQLSKAWINSFLFAKAPTADAKYRVDYDVPFEPSITMVDIQNQHATSCELPSRRFPGEQGWYVNVGEQEGTTESQFEFNFTLGGR